MAETKNRFEYLHEESKKFADAVGLPHDIILKIYKSETDWEFLLKIDALLETAVKEVIKKSLSGTKLMDQEKLEGFVEALPVNGRSSLLALLKAVSCPGELVDMIECVRRLRNGFAHDIKQIDSSLLDVIKKRNDRSVLIRGLCAIETYDEKSLIESYERDGNFLRFAIIDGALRFLVMAYHVVLK